MKYPLTVILTLLASGWSAIIRVPAEQPTIQAGLNAAGSGDTVLVAPGHYLENIIWPSRDGICLLSDSGPEQTTIDGNSARVITFSPATTRATLLAGFRITGGKTSSAAGVYIPTGSPSLIGNIIEGNTCTGGRDYGAGIYIGSGTRPLIRSNIIRNNTCSDTSTWNHGAGIFIERQARPEISYNLITGNTCSKGYWNYGAGIFIDLQGDGIIYQNIIADNQCTEGDRGHGAGIYVYYGATPLIFCNIIRDNTCSSGGWNYGAGINCQAPALIVSNTIIGNTCTGGTWRYGGGIYLDSQALVKNNIIVSNRAASGGGIYNFRGAITQVDYNDVWNNAGGNYYNCPPGSHDISLDPCFVTGVHGDYYLSQIAAGQPVNSPCVNAGTAGVLPDSIEQYLRIWTTRTDSVGDDSTFDIGYHYPRGEYPVALRTSQPVPAPLPVLLVEPNPCRERIRFIRPAPAATGLALYDAAGRLLRQYRLACGAQSLELSIADLPAGVYCYRWTGAVRLSGTIIKQH